LFLAAFIENLFPPIPGDVFVLFGAYLVGTGKLNYIFAYLSATSGSVTGFMIVYYVGLFVGRSLIEKSEIIFFKIKINFISKETFKKIENWFNKYGSLVIIANRFLAAGRSVISLFAGIGKMNPIKVFVFSSISCLLWNGMLIYLGVKIGENWQEIKNILTTYNHIILVVISTIVIIYIIRKFLYKAKYTQ
jgi:membrane protein DedA with SNARE-associated domain